MSAFMKCRRCLTTKIVGQLDVLPAEFVCNECLAVEQAEISDQVRVTNWMDTLMEHHLGQIRIASIEGRLHPDLAAALNLETGQHACPICGMLHFGREEADECCLPGVEVYAVVRREAANRSVNIRLQAHLTNLIRDIRREMAP